MTHFFVNLKRFDVPASSGGICPSPDPVQWIEDVATELAAAGIPQRTDQSLVFLLPESLLVPFRRAVRAAGTGLSDRIGIGVQTVFRSDVSPGGNFGAFTANLPAAAAVAAGAQWAMVGHSEERLDKSRLMEMVAGDDGDAQRAVADAVNSVVAQEAACAAARGMNVLVCVGETEQERGAGSLSEVGSRVAAVLDRQLSPLVNVWRSLERRPQLVVGYEPRWAIGPGKTPPDAEYIGFVADHIRTVLADSLGSPPAVVYGGGLKTENAREIASVPSIAGGLIALTKFTGTIGFTVPGLAEIIATYTGGDA